MNEREKERGLRHRVFARFFSHRHYTNGRLQVFQSFKGTHQHRVNVRAGWLPSLGNSRCMRCQTPWWACEGHTTMYSEDSGCFPLCERCWIELEPYERMPYYAYLIREWEQWGPVEPDKEAAIYEAVVAGK